jgi:hypothetical protein
MPAAHPSVIYSPHPLTGRRPTSAEARARHRAGRGPGKLGGRNLFEPVWDEPPRNGLPWKPYRYRGTGADAYTGEVVL